MRMSPVWEEIVLESKRRKRFQIFSMLFTILISTSAPLFIMEVEQESFEELKRVCLKYVLKENDALLQQCVENFVSKPETSTWLSVSHLWTTPILASVFEDRWGELLSPPQHLLTLPFDEEAVEEQAVFPGVTIFILELRLRRRERLGQPAWKRNCFIWERDHLCEIFDGVIVRMVVVMRMMTR